jgi:ATP-dependent DNA helicase HFM1/MER3
MTPPVHSASSSFGGSSPSVRLPVQRQQTRIVRRDPIELQSSGKHRLTLGHAPHDLPPVVAGTQLICPRQVLPDKCRSIFPYEVFNIVQSKCFHLVYDSLDNVVISAPTGSGKTAVLELAICKLIASPGGENFKIVYQAPTKSLCSERARDWETKFRHLNLRCVELTGDTSHVEAKRVGGASIIVTTPEKWDSITRKWSDHRKLLEMVRLVLIDEVHILKDVRGATLEAVVSRMKTIGANVRFVALSATIPNLADVAAWIGRNHANQNEPAMSISFGEEVRPVKLRKHVYGYDHPGNDFIFDRSIDGKLNMLLRQHADGKPIMIFCFTRKSCEQTARKLAEWWTTLGTQDKPWQSPTEPVAVINKDLQEITCYGVSFHHAGLDVQDKACIERSFLSGQLHVICCTSTLAVGINLPCHTVVLKGTTGYTNDGPQEYSDLEVMQMLGRAGRPQFDQSAVAIIMTKKSNVDRYERMVSGQEVLESKLHLNLIEHINSEVGLGTIQDLPTANRWIAGTFLTVRMRQSPDRYHAEVDAGEKGTISTDEIIRAWCERDMKLLQEHRLITTDTPFRCTEYGLAMSRYMVQFETMRMLLAIPASVDVEQLVSLTTLPLLGLPIVALCSFPSPAPDMLLSSQHFQSRWSSRICVSNH